MMKTVLAALLAAAAAPAIAAPTAEVRTGVEIDEGDYGTGAEVERLTVRSELRARSGDFLLSASLPWHRIEGPGNIVGGGGPLGLPILDPTRPSERTTRSGLGDLRVGAAWAPRIGGFGLALGGEVKLPTASARQGLGTGETDITVAAEAARTIGPVTPFAAVSYTMPGDPEGFELRDSIGVRGGIAAQLGRRVRGTVTLAHAESMSPALANERQVSTGLDIGLSDRVSLGIYGSAGLSDGSPDSAAGVQIGWRLF